MEVNNYTSLTKRVLNFIIDSVLILFVWSVLFYVVLIFVSRSGLIDVIEEAVSFQIDYSILFVAFLYYILFEGVFKTTPGKLITKTKIIKNNGENVRFSDALLRTVIRLIPIDPFFYLGKEPIGWHDRFTKTKVIDKEKTARV